MVESAKLNKTHNFGSYCINFPTMFTATIVSLLCFVKYYLLLICLANKCPSNKNSDTNCGAPLLCSHRCKSTHIYSTTTLKINLNCLLQWGICASNVRANLCWVTGFTGLRMMRELTQRSSERKSPSDEREDKCFTGLNVFCFVGLINSPSPSMLFLERAKPPHNRRYSNQNYTTASPTDCTLTRWHSQRKLCTLCITELNLQKRCWNFSHFGE